MYLLPCLIVDPVSGRVYGMTNCTPEHAEHSHQEYLEGRRKVVYAIWHPNIEMPPRITHVSLRTCLLVDTLEQPNK